MSATIGQTTAAYNSPSHAANAVGGDGDDKLTRTAKAFEAQFLSQLYQFMYEGVQTDGMFGGGEGEKMFRSMLFDEYAKMTVERPGGSGLGIAEAVRSMLLKQQEAG
ncbi:MAG: hypothetical protein RLZZ501_2409 [Pseudomonadota bacterium]|jgi:flagellar protein FlgJ